MKIFDNFKKSFNELVDKGLSQEEKQFSEILDQLDDNLNDNDEQAQKTKPLKEQLEGLEPIKEKSSKKIIYYLNNFWKKLYFFEYKDYTTGQIIRGMIRGSSRKEAWDNAKELYQLKHDPDILKPFEIDNNNFFEKFRINPLFFLIQKIDKKELGLFLKEYASLMSDGLSKKQAINILLKMIKDKSLRDFLYDFRDSSYTMSVLMRNSWKFDEYTISLIESAESAWGSSQFYDWLSKLGQAYEEEAEFQREFKKSLAYPIWMMIFLVILVLISLIKVVPVLAWVFANIVWKDKIPSLMISLLEISNNIWIIIWEFIVFLVLVIAIKKILLSNPSLLVKWELFKLKIPLIWKIIQKKEENKIMTIFAQTIYSQVSPTRKIKMLKNATTSKLYTKVFLYALYLYPSKQNIVWVFEEVNKAFQNKVLGEKFMIMMKLAQESATTDKRLVKYKNFLDKNIKELKETMDSIKFITTSLIIVAAVSLVFFIILTVASVTFSLMG